MLKYGMIGVLCSLHLLLGAPLVAMDIHIHNYYSTCETSIQGGQLLSSFRARSFLLCIMECSILSDCFTVGYKDFKICHLVNECGSTDCPVVNGRSTSHFFSKTICKFPMKKTVNITATCDNTLQIYLDGNLQQGNAYSLASWHMPTNIHCPSSTAVIGLKCVNSGAQAGILASLTDGRTTDTLSWKCSNQEEAGWSTSGFDDSHWDFAKSIGKHGVYPWRKITGISDTAEWIWTSDLAHLTVYCRLVL